MRVGAGARAAALRLRLPQARGAHRAPGRTTRTGRGRSCARPRWCRSRRRWCACTRSTCTSSTATSTRDYVFVNLFGGRVGAAMTYPAVHQLIGRIAARTGIGFTAHMLRHSHATEHDPPGRADRGGRPAAHPPVLDDHEPDLRPSRRRRRPRGAAPGRGRGTSEEGAMTSPVPAAAGQAAAPGGQRRGGRPSTASGPRTTGTPGAWASPPGADAARRASTGSASPGCATRSSAGPGSGWPPGARSPPSTPGHWRSPGSPRFLADASPAGAPTRARSPGRSWRTTCPGCSPRDTRRPPGRCRCR